MHWGLMMPLRQLERLLRFFHPIFEPLTDWKSRAAVFSAVSPHWAFKFLIDHGHNGWVMLGGVLLCVTGAEAYVCRSGSLHKSCPSR